MAFYRKSLASSISTENINIDGDIVLMCYSQH